MTTTEQPVLNTARIHALADFIDNMDSGTFDMNETLFVPRREVWRFIATSDAEPNAINRRAYISCGTVGCIAGWAVAAFATQEELELNDLHDDAMDMATELLGLNEVQSDELFAPGYTNNWADITPKEAAETLRNLAETSGVDWSQTLPPDCRDCNERDSNCTCFSCDGCDSCGDCMGADADC